LVAADLCPIIHFSDTCGVNENLVGRPFWNDFSIPGDNLNACPIRGTLHGLKDSMKIIQRKSFFQDQPHTEIQRFGSAHGHIIDGPVDGQFSNITTWKKERIDRVGIGGERKPHVPHLEQGSVVHFREYGIVEQGHQDFRNHLMRDFSTAAVVQKNTIIFHNSFVLSVKYNPGAWISALIK